MLPAAAMAPAGSRRSPHPPALREATERAVVARLLRLPPAPCAASPKSDRDQSGAAGSLARARPRLFPAPQRPEGIGLLPAAWPLLRRVVRRAQPVAA